MGGLKMSRRGEILDENNQVIPGLYGAGEVTGGVHGSNRLAGNSLLECLVFGRIVGTQIASNKKKKTVAAVSVVAKTAIDAIYAKHSAIRAGYNPMVPDQQELYEELLEDMTVRMEQCRYDDISQQPSKRRQQTALVNAGYASRVLAMSHRIQSFLLYHQMTAVAGRKTNIQLIFLGCGLDVIGLWAAKSFKPPQSSWLDLTVVEVDMMEVYHFKRDILKSSGNHDMVQNLTEHFGAGAGSDDNRHCTGRIGYARNEEQNDSIEQDCHYHNYLLIPTDLTKDLPRLDAILQDHSIPFSATSSTLIISELVLAYLPPSGTDTLLMWCADKFASIPGSAIVAIEPLGCDKLAAGAGDVVAVEDGYRRDYCRKFQDKMQRGRNTNNGDSICGQTLFHPMGTSLKNVTWRLQEAGFCKASTTSLGIAATLAAAATSPSKTLNCPEIFDEHAALALHLQSYVVTCGVSCATSNEGDAMLFGRVMCPWECGSNTLKLARSCLPWFDCYDKMVYTEIQPEHDSQVCSLFEITYQEYVEDYPAIRKMVKGVLKKELNAMHSMRTASNEKGFNEFTRSSSIAEFYRSNKGIFLVAVRYGIEDGEHDKEVVGFVGIRSCEAKNVENGTMEIFRLAVHKRYRRRGIARNLLAAVEMFALDQCCPKIVANTLTILDAACNLYASHGFMAEKVASLGPQLQMTTFVKIPFAYTDDASDKSTDFVKLTHDDSREEQSDYDRLGYEQAEPTLHLRRRGSLLGHIMAWADKVNEEHMGPSFGQLNDCESLGSNYRRSRLDYGRRASLDVTSTDTDFTNKRNRRRIHSSDNFNNSGSDENSSIEPRRVGSGRRNSLDAFVEQAVAYRNLRPDPSDDEMCPFGTRRDSLF
jgi:ribosomal protein S18 acetylase RimI-like enzyme/O-methyltransferase involved in polyketide biosynthesis